MRTVCGTILAAAVAVTCAVGMADGGDSVSGRGTTPATTFAAQYLVEGVDPAMRPLVTLEPDMGLYIVIK